MHANRLLHALVRRVPVHTEAEREELAAAVDVAFPPDEHAPDGGTTPDTPDTPDTLQKGK